MGNKNSTAAKSDSVVSNTNEVYIEAMTVYSSSLEQYSKAYNKAVIGKIKISGNKNIVNTELNQDLTCAQFMAAQDAVKAALESNNSVNDKIAALAEMNNEAKQKGGVLSSSNAETISSSEVNSANKTQVINKLEIAINNIQDTIAENSATIAGVEIDGDENNVIIEINQKADDIQKMFKDLKVDAGVESDNTKQSDTKKKDNQTNNSEQKGTISGLGDNVEEVGKDITEEVGSSLKTYMIIAAIVVMIIFGVIGYVVFRHPETYTNTINAIADYEKAALK